MAAHVIPLNKKKDMRTEDNRQGLQIQHAGEYAARDHRQPLVIKGDGDNKSDKQKNQAEETSSNKQLAAVAPRYCARPETLRDAAYLHTFAIVMLVAAAAEVAVPVLGAQRSQHLFEPAIVSPDYHHRHRQLEETDSHNNTSRMGHPKDTTRDGIKEVRREQKGGRK